MASQAFAQDIRVKMDQIPSGSWVASKLADKISIQVFRGKQGNGYIVDFVPGNNPNSRRTARDVRDKNGNVLRRTEANGRITTYRPHNCQRVVGRCSFVQKTGAQTVSMERVTTLKGSGFDFEQNAVFSDGAMVHVQSGKIKSLDEFGIVERASGTQGVNRKKFSTRKIKASWD